MKKLDRILLGAFVLLVAFTAGYFTKNPFNWPKSSLPEEVVMISRANLNKNINPNDAAIWAGLLSQARICENCSGLREWAQGSWYMARPIALTMRSDDPSVGYTMVFGQIGSTEGGGRTRVPMIAYYIGHRSGYVARVDGDTGKVEFRTSWGEWKPVEDGNPIVAEARRFFREKWNIQLATTTQ